MGNIITLQKFQITYTCEIEDVITMQRTCVHERIIDKYINNRALKLVRPYSHLFDFLCTYSKTILQNGKQM
jgi:hypothetical protein